MAKLNLKPLSGYALVEPEEAAPQTASGLYLPDNAQEKPARGKVLAVGSPTYSEGKEIKAEFKVGDRVIYKKWGGDEIKIDNKELKLVKFDDVMAIVE